MSPVAGTLSVAVLLLSPLAPAVAAENGMTPAGAETGTAGPQVAGEHAVAVPTAGGPVSGSVGPALPPRVRALLIQEMVAVLGASKAILEALVRGQDAVVAEQAQAIHDSFIMDREMSEADRHGLHEAVPAAFIERDRAFHALAAGLAAAARQGDQARQRGLFKDMLDACAGCHARFAADRFPDLRIEAGAEPR